uniref:PH_RBD domain-containing protein n=1 Tax=Haemonchus contortus TaxID=6289 RepID=A0A7I4XRR5_HAECO|nr:unnamed protein product [Haemonchus contortus]
MPPLSRDSESTAMIVRKWHKSTDTVTLSFTVASEIGKPPLVVFSKEVEKAWKGLVDKHNLNQRTSSQLSKIASLDQIDEKESPKDGVKKSCTGEESTIEVAVHLIRSEQHASTA